jgi:hypothetical protein
MLLWALSIMFAVVPASAAGQPSSCLHNSNFNGFRACQNRARADAVAAAARKGEPLTPAQLDELDDEQRAEARKFFARPETVVVGPKEAPDSANSTKRLGGVTASDLGRVDAKSAAGIEGLQGRLQSAAGDGKDGITPAMADDIRAALTSEQGGVSPDMASLLDAVQRDGGKLTPETMTKLQGAAKAAKDDGLDLNIDPNIEKQLLEDDFSKDKTNNNFPPAGM